MNKKCYNTAEAATYLGISESYLKQSRMTSPRARKLDAPEYKKFSCRKTVYFRESLDAWLDSQQSMINGSIKPIEKGCRS